MTFFFPTLFFPLKLNFFAPFLIRVLYLRPLISSLWVAIWIGLLLDLFSSSARFGINAFAGFFTVFILYQFKKHFFEDSYSTLPFMCYFYGFFNTVILIPLMDFFDRHLTLSLPFLLSDLLFFPFLDALYALFVFTLPRLFFGKPIRKGSDYFLNRSLR